MIQPIPYYYRGKAGRGAHIWCNSCKTTKTHDFHPNGTYSGCSHKNKLTYVSHPWNKYLKKITNRKSYPEIKTFAKFRRAHEEYLRKLEDSNFNIQVKAKKKSLPIALKQCSGLYVDYMEGIGIAPQEWRHFEKSTINRFILHYNRFIDSLKAKGCQTHIMTIHDITEEEAGIYHDYIWTIEGVNKNSTHNEHMSSVKGFFDYLIDIKKYPITNPFATAKKKRTKPKKIYIERNEFDYFMSLISKENGHHKTSKTNYGSSVQMYKPYLKDAFELALLTSARKTDVFHIKWSNVLPSVIEIPNKKTTEVGEEDILYFAPRTAQLNELLVRLGEDKYIHTDKHILCPESTSKRQTLSDHVSRGFTHYWGLTGYSKKATLHSLRSTGITRMEILLGKHIEELDTHADKKTREEFYVNQKEVLSSQNEKSFW